MRLTGISAILVGALAFGGGAAAKTAGDGTSPPQPQKLAANADAPAEGPVQIIVSVPEQRADVYVGGKLIAESPVSTGRKGHATPTGVFSILQKRRYHRSNIYSRAPMPYMQRLTWSGIALHGSNQVPDYPASHGCVRLPPKFAKTLFGVTEMGAHVIIANGETAPFEISHANLFQPVPLQQLAAASSDIAVDGPLSVRAVDEPPQTAPALIEPTDAEQTRDMSPLRILVTRRVGRELVRDVQTLLTDLGFDPGKVDGWMGRDTGGAISRFQESRGLQKTGAMSDELVAELYRAAGKDEPPTGHVYVRRNFAPVFDAPITIAPSENPLGNHLFTAMDFADDATEARWLAVSLNERLAESPQPEPEEEGAASAPTPGTAEEALSRIDIPASVRQRISEMLTPGSSLAISESGISKETIDKGTDFVVLTR